MLPKQGVSYLQSYLPGMEPIWSPSKLKNSLCLSSYSSVLPLLQICSAMAPPMARGITKPSKRKGKNFTEPQAAQQLDAPRVQSSPSFFLSKTRSLTIFDNYSGRKPSPTCCVYLKGAFSLSPNSYTCPIEWACIGQYWSKRAGQHSTLVPMRKSSANEFLLGSFWKSMGSTQTTIV